MSIMPVALILAKALGGIQFLGDKLVSWMSKKQDCTAMSSAKVEYVALSASCAQVMWMRTQLKDYGSMQQNTVVLRLSVSHSNLMQPRAALPYQAHPYSPFLKDRFQYLVRQIGMRYLTPAEWGGSEIFNSIEGTILEEKLFAEFDKFMAMTADENSESKSETEEPPFKKITFNTDYKIKTSLEEPPTDLELKPLPDNLDHVFLEEPSFLPVIISSQLYE
ncbi:hypothetical protein Tco_1107682 [Tanacetum coccineum]